MCNLHNTEAPKLFYAYTFSWFFCISHCRPGGVWVAAGCGGHGHGHRHDCANGGDGAVDGDDGSSTVVMIIMVPARWKRKKEGRHGGLAGGWGGAGEGKEEDKEDGGEMQRL